MSGPSVDERDDGEVRIVIADDHALVRAGLRMMLEDEPDMEVVGEAADGAQALGLALALAPTVVLADISMPPPDGIELARRLSRDLPGVKTIMVTMHEDADMLRDALAAGAAGYVAKRSGPDEMLRAIRAVAAGEIYIDRNLR
ncbi:MAG: response regulator transcription factor [Nitrososphaerales archaeon]